MPQQDGWVGQFEEHRPRLRALAQRMLGTTGEADDAVQETWLRLSRVEPSEVDNLGGWLTTVVARICLNLLRSRANRREGPLDRQLPSWVVRPLTEGGPEEEAVSAETVGVALQVVLDTLSPAERVAFVLHDLFAVPFAEIAPLVQRSPAATRQLASRARRRVRAGSSTSGLRRVEQRRVVETFLAASRDGDLDGLVRILDPGIVLRVDAGGVSASGPPVRSVRGATSVAEQASAYARLAGPGIVSRPAYVDGEIGVVSFREGRLFSVLRFRIVDGLVVGLDILADPVRLGRYELPGPA